MLNVWQAKYLFSTMFIVTNNECLWNKCAMTESSDILEIFPCVIWQWDQYSISAQRLLVKFDWVLGSFIDKGFLGWYQCFYFSLPITDAEILQHSNHSWKINTSVCLTLLEPPGFGDFRKKNSSLRLPYQHPSSSAHCAREPFSGSNGSASLVNCTRKKIFCLGGAVFLWVTS